MGKFSKILWLTTKAGICVGSVYLTVDQGVWGSPQQSKALTNKVCTSVPGFKAFKDEYLSVYLPRSDNVNINFRHYWNSALLYTCDFIAESPTKAGQLKDYVVKTVSSLISEGSSVEKKEKQL